MLGNGDVKQSSDESRIASRDAGISSHLHDDHGIVAARFDKELDFTETGLETGRLHAGCDLLCGRCGVDCCLGVCCRLELVGVLATSVAAVSAKPPSAPCGGTFELLFLPLRVLPFGVASLVGSLWARACFRGSCRVVGPCGLLLRLLGLRALSGVAGAGSGVAISSVSLKTWRSPMLPGYFFTRQGFSWWSPLSG